MKLSRNQQTDHNIRQYRTGYQEGYRDFTMFRPAQDLQDVVAADPKFITGYNAGYSHARRGLPKRYQP